MVDSTYIYIYILFLCRILHMYTVLYYHFGFNFLFHALTVEGYHVYFNCRYVCHNSTSARAEMSLITVCYKKQPRTAQRSRPRGLWTGGHTYSTVYVQC